MIQDLPYEGFKFLSEEVNPILLFLVKIVRLDIF